MMMIMKSLKVRFRYDTTITWDDLEIAAKWKSQERKWISINSGAIKINYLKINIDHMQENSKYSLCGDREETVYYIINEC